MVKHGGGFYLLQLHVLSLCIAAGTAWSATLSADFYEKTCPNALPTIKRVVVDAVKQEPRMGASLLRLHFHDCFVNGCDASILLDSTSSFDSEKDAVPNKNSVRGFSVIDRIKSEVDKACGSPVVSCADILAVAARDSVVALGGPTWKVQLGRRDSTSASKSQAEADLPSPFMDLSELKSNFKKQGLSTKDLVALSGGHVIGVARCVTFKNRIYNETNIDSVFARERRSTCPANGGDGNLAPLDQTANTFDTRYFSNLVKRRGLLHSDQVLYNGGETDSLVKKYSTNSGAFGQDFANSMIKMGNMKPLTGKKGQIRVDCKRVN
ncbi:peroxidase P7-like [Diospyros lotus]|uniref:peroxidase P7-like n=1 Tax=Diospyros lotus TaxID=55363 RepID=UPI00225AE313|nr:peroxidase P7-like [Diospyros lotus]